ncbi:MAG: gamma-glutamyltransferase family protein [Firmicutes bacterium]|jgi:gamma-glutamyltranspeptidase/glutathione hydrolase|nr:gamma-glutamyltransferase family protein [Bacillota bacterium]
MGMRGVVATSHPLAAQAGLRMLMSGGNAVDAALAAAAALVVLEPTSNGLGGDAFALVWDGQLYGLNASGRAPMSLSAEGLRSEGYASIPTEGWLPVTVPGAVSAWSALSRRFGTMPLSEVLRPAVEYAERGAPVPPVIAGHWRAAEKRFGTLPDFARAFLPHGRAPAPGEIFSCADLARSLRLIGETGGEAFYRGALADAVASHAERTGGYITREDLASHAPEWVDPISTSYRGYEVFEIPPNGQGLVALIALNILEGYDMGRIPQLSADSLHLVIEALRLALADGHAHIADPRSAPVPIAQLLSKTHAAHRRETIHPRRAGGEACSGLPGPGDTVYLCAADESGVMVSYIQSNYMGFGSGIVVPGTGISLQNRGAGFSLAPGHPNELAPGKRPFHTIIPGFLMYRGTPVAAFGVMGGDMQPQGHVQVVSGIVDHGLNPQSSVDCPRIRVMGGGVVAVESGIGAETARELAQMGHSVRVEAEMAGFGGAQIIWRDPDTGVMIAGSEPRKDGYPAAF